MERKKLTIEEKIQKELAKTKKRREVAISFIEFVSSFAEELSEFFPTKCNAFWIGNSLYLRFGEHRGDMWHSETEKDIYVADHDLPCWGTPLAAIQGRDFWYYMKILWEWWKSLPEKIEAKASQEEKLIQEIQKCLS